MAMPVIDKGFIRFAAEKRWTDEEVLEAANVMKPLQSPAIRCVGGEGSFPERRLLQPPTPTTTLRPPPTSPPSFSAATRDRERSD
jgi:hypothetical protein